MQMQTQIKIGFAEMHTVKTDVFHTSQHIHTVLFIWSLNFQVFFIYVSFEFQSFSRSEPVKEADSSQSPINQDINAAIETSFTYHWEHMLCGAVTVTWATKSSTNTGLSSLRMQKQLDFHGSYDWIVLPWWMCSGWECWDCSDTYVNSKFW